MKKILLTAINAKYIHSNLAVYNLKAYAKKYADASNVEIAEFTINHLADDILQEIYKKRPDVLCLSCYIWNLNMIEELLPSLAKILPHTEIWIGGPEVTYNAEEFLNIHPQVDGVMLGEGEETFCDLVRYYGGEKQISEIDGIVWRKQPDNTIFRGKERMPIHMDTIPFVYEDLQVFDHRIIYYESSRGCPFSCSYCLSSIDKRVRFRSIELVKQELQFFLDHQVPQVKFVDRTFNCRHEHALEIWNYIREHDNQVTNFHFEIAADLLNEEELLVLEQMRPGLVQLEIGVQSTNPKTIREIDRVMDFEKLSEIVRRLQKRENIHLHLDLIAGLPYEDHQSFIRSFCDVYRLYPEQLQLGFLKVLKGSKMHRMAEQYGLCSHDRPMFEVFYTNWISYDEILKLKRIEEMVELYYNSCQFVHTIRRLEQEFTDPYAMYEALALYHEQEGYVGTGQKIARSMRYDFLRSFISQHLQKEKKEEQLAEYESLLLLDLYLRENSKTRPAWAMDLSVYKKAMQEFYEQEEWMKKFLPAYEGRSAKQRMHMTHLEPLTFDGKTRRWFLFDYQKRNPISHDASVLEVTENMDLYLPVR